MSGPASSRKTQVLRLKLYIAGDSPNSVAAVRHLRALLSEYPTMQADLEIIDVLEHPEAGLKENILVTPTMLKVSPKPTRRIIGSLKDAAALRAALGIYDLE
jgi:circadian clock protein KaiB